jgi:two-component system, cell cycle response regulator
MKVLIIDDDPDAMEVAKVRLAKEHLDIVCAEGGALGLEAAHRENPDLILLDVEMPDMSGYDVCQTLKADRELCMVPVLFLSGSNDTRDKVHGLDVGGVDYITKPFDAFELCARVRAALRTKHLQDLLSEYAHIDPLTGLPNRRALMQRLQAEWARIERHGGQLAFIMADLDHFKQVNDRYGHQVGDQVLQEVAGIFDRQSRKTNLPCRCGGEEFAIIVPDENASGAVCLAERCRRQIAESCANVKNQMVLTTASFGVADSSDAASLESLMVHADMALYRAKEAGRNRVETYRATSAALPIVPGKPVAGAAGLEAGTTTH